MSFFSGLGSFLGLSAPTMPTTTMNTATTPTAVPTVPTGIDSSISGLQGIQANGIQNYGFTDAGMSGLGGNASNITALNQPAAQNQSAMNVGQQTGGTDWLGALTKLGTLGASIYADKANRDFKKAQVNHNIDKDKNAQARTKNIKRSLTGGSGELVGQKDYENI